METWIEMPKWSIITVNKQRMKICCPLWWVNVCIKQPSATYTILVFGVWAAKIVFMRKKRWSPPAKHTINMNHLDLSFTKLKEKEMSRLRLLNLLNSEKQYQWLIWPYYMIILKLWTGDWILFQSRYCMNIWYFHRDFRSQPWPQVPVASCIPSINHSSYRRTPYFPANTSLSTPLIPKSGLLK